MIDNISNDLIKELRKRTSVSIIKCKQALIESKGNIELAIDSIRRSGLKTDLIQSNRPTSSGLVMSKILPNEKKGLMIEINCETDFVSRNSMFQEFADTVITIALNESINNINSLKTRLEDQRSVLSNKTGENIQIRRFSVLTGNFLSSYVHGSKIGVMVAASKNVNKNIIKYIAMHIAARNPKYICIHDIPEDFMMRERHIQMDIAMRSGKSQKIAEKIVEGRIDKLMSEIVLTKQDFIIDTTRTVGGILEEHDVNINNFIRFEIGDDN